jgi:hypothetical protein
LAECVIDRRPTTDALICQSCLEELKTELRQVPWLVEQLGITLTRQARVGERNGPRSSETPLPYHVGASDELDVLRDTLWMWARAVAEQRGIDLPEVKDSVELGQWMLRHPHDIAQHVDVGELHGDVLAILKTIRRTIDLGPNRFFLGPCDNCGADLYVWARAGAERLPSYARCATEGCGAEYDMAERRAWLLEAAYDRLLTAAEMSRAIRALLPGDKEISSDLIRQWAHRGRIVKYLHHPHDLKRQPRYRVEDVVQMARDKATGESRNRPT